MKQNEDKLAEELARARKNHSDLQRLSKPLMEQLGYIRNVLQRLGNFPATPCLIHDRSPAPAVRTVTHPFSIGSDPLCDTVLTGDRVASQHARIESADEGWSLRCLCNGAPVEVNGSPVMQAILASGDVITVAGHKLIFIDSEAVFPPLP